MRLFAFISLVLGIVLIASTPSLGQRMDSLKTALEKARSPAIAMAIQKELIDSLLDRNKEQAVQYLEALLNTATKNQSYEYLGYGMERTAGLSYFAGQLDSARAQYNRAYGHYLKAKDRNKALKAYTRTGIMHSLQGSYAEAEKIYRKVMGQMRGLPEVEAFVENQMGTLYHYQGKQDSAAFYYNQSVAAYTVLKDTLGLLRPLFNHAVLLMENGDRKEALEKYLQIKNIQERLKAYGELLYTLNALSSIYSTQGDVQKGLEYARLAYRYAKEVGNDLQRVSALNRLATIFSENKDYESAIKYYQEALEFAKAAKTTDEEQRLLYLLGNTYLKLEQYDRAIACFENGLKIADAQVENRSTSFILVALGQTYILTGNLPKAKQYLKRAIELAQKTGQIEALYDGYGVLAKASLLDEEPKEAARYALLALNASKEAKNLERSMANAEVLFQAYKQMSQYESALQYHELFKTLSDSINDTEKVRQLTSEAKDMAFQLEKQKIEATQQQREVLLKASARQNLIVSISIGVLALLILGFLWNSRRKNQVISQRNQQLEQLSLTKDRIFAIIGHDLRKPALAFRGITKKVNYLLKKQDFETLNAIGAQIEQDAQSLNQLTDNLLSWALSQKNVLPHQPAALNLAGEVSEVLDIFTASSSEKQIELCTDIPNNLEVFADQNALRTIIRNLVDNALKYTPAKGKVTISAATSPEGIVLQVLDTGVGMPEEKLRSIFLLQKDKSEQGTAGEKGIGLGMHLVHELVKINRGTIRAFSRVGEGTRFTVVLPQSAD